MKDLDAIYVAARALSLEERPAYLARNCAGDEALRARVEQMLAVAEEAEAFITDLPDDEWGAQRPGRQPAETRRLEFTDTLDETIGQKIGRYKILECLGEGGCGVVYVAEQTEPVRRRVALKVIKPGMDTKAVVARFEAERQALAMMDHPNIAKVHDAGTTEAGRPYFVMELVRGTRITDYCDEAKLGTQNRLNLFIDVCHAIQHAHQKGIIHRDIKPSNILVTLHDGVPVPKVIDFGIAKATEGRLTDATIYTQLHQFIGTPAYMSPEQAEMSGLDIDTRSDIYSLGVLLYELLAGCTPFDAQELMASGIDAMRKTIREKEPLRPSTKLATLKGDELSTTAKRRSSEAPKLIHTLKGDLDWVVMKCLEKDRTRRYETASGLANDLKRHLENEPVVARPPSAAYRMQKAFRRNRLAFIAVFAVGLTLLAGTTLSTWQAVEATRARKEENKQRIAAEKSEAHASRQQKKAEAEKQRAEEQLTRAEWLLYASKLMQAQDDFEVGNGALALHYLSECQEKLRGWEWRYLWNRVNTGLTLTGLSSVAFSPDGQRIASCLLKTACVLDATTGEELFTLTGHKGNIYCVEFSRDGRRIVTSGQVYTPGELGEAKVWDAQTGRQLLDLPGHNYPLWSVAISPDGRRIVTGGGDRGGGPGEVKVWDTTTGQELLKLASTKNVRCVAFSPDSRRIVVGYWSSDVKVWDATTGDDLLTLNGHRGLIASVAFSPDGQRILSGSWDRTAKVWDATSGLEILALKGHASYVTSAAFSPDGKRIVTGSYDKTVKIWSAETAREIFTLKGHAQNVMDVAFSPDGKRVTTCGNDNTVRVWDAEKGQEIPTISGHSDAVNGVAFRPDGKRFVTGSDDGTARVWDAETLHEVLCLKSRAGPVWSVAYSADGERIATGSQDKSATIWDAETGQKLLVLQHTNAVLSVAFSPDGSRLVAGAGSHGEPAHRPGETTVWDTETGQRVLTLQNSQPAWSVAYSPDGRRIVAGLWSGVAKVWDAATGQELFSLKGHKRSVGGVAFSADGKRIATGSHDGTARVWDAETGREFLTLKGHTDNVRCVAFSPDGQRIITASDDWSVKLWDRDTGLEIFALKGHTREVFSVAFSPDGQRIVTCGSHDKTVKIWSAPPTTPMAAPLQP